MEDFFKIVLFIFALCVVLALIIYVVIPFLLVTIAVIAGAGFVSGLVLSCKNYFELLWEGHEKL